MRNLRWLALMIVSLFILSCGSSKSTTRNANISPGNTSFKTPDAVLDQIKGTLQSKSGEKLFYTFDNRVNTMEIVFNGETIKLKKEPTASGIKYSSKNYIYTEWHGTGTLTKNGTTIFEENQE